MTKSSSFKTIFLISLCWLFQGQSQTYYADETNIDSLINIWSQNNTVYDTTYVNKPFTPKISYQYLCPGGGLNCELEYKLGILKASPSYPYVTYIPNQDATGIDTISKTLSSAPLICTSRSSTKYCYNHSIYKTYNIVILPEPLVTYLAKETHHAGPTLFPTPTTGLVNITHGLKGEVNIKILDQQGIVRYVTRETSQASCSFDINNLSNGLYFVEISNDDEKVITKVIKE